jgi:hypothetical protein
MNHFENSAFERLIKGRLMNTRRHFFVCLLALGGAADDSPVLADHFAARPVAFNSFDTRVITQTGVYGWRFSSNETIQVTRLGVWDRFDNGLERMTPVGLWRADGGFIASDHVTNSDLLTGPRISDTAERWRFRYTSLPSPVQIPQGSYVIAAELQHQPYIYNLESAGTSSPIVYHSSRRSPGGLGLRFPTQRLSIEEIAYFGANFQYVIPSRGQTIPSGSTIDFGETGRDILTNGDLTIESTGDDDSYVDLLGITFDDGSAFSLASGDANVRLLSDGTEGSGNDLQNLVFQFDPTGLSPGLYTDRVVINTSLDGSLEFALQAHVIPEPASCVLVAFGFIGAFAAARNWRPT